MDFLDKEAEESSDSEEEIPKKRAKIVASSSSDSSEDSSDEEEDDEEQIRKESAGFIVDDDDEEDDGEVGPMGATSPKQKSKEQSSDEDDDMLDDDDYDLIQENIGVNVRRKKAKRRLIVDSDEEESDEERVEKGRIQIAKEIFEADDDEESVCPDNIEAVPSKRTAAIRGEAAAAGSDEEEEEEEDEDDMSHFIVNEHGEPLEKKKKKPIHKDAALQEAQDIFGVDFDFEEIEGFGDEEEGEEEAEDEEVEDEEDEDDEEDYSDADSDVESRRARRKAKKRALARAKATSMYDVFDPTELERGFHTEKDKAIRLNDQPERFQIRTIPVKACDRVEVEEEAEWIFRQGFLKMSITQQDLPGEGSSRNQSSRRSPHVRNKIREALHFIRNHSLEVPFIAFYRKEYVEPELKIEDLWSIYKMDETWCQLRTSKENLITLMEQMRDHLEEKRADIDVRFVQTRNKVEAAQTAAEEQVRREHRKMLRKEMKAAAKKKEGEEGDDEEAKDEDEDDDEEEEPIKGLLSDEDLAKLMREFEKIEKERTAMLRELRPLTTDDVVRARMADTLEEVRDVYTYFILFYGNEVEVMKINNRKRKKNAVSIENEEEEEEEEEEAPQFKRATRQSMYARGMHAGLGPLTRMFGLSPEQLSENMRDQYQRHEVEQHHEMPLEAAAHFVNTPHIPTPEYAIRLARQMVAAQIAAEPSVRQIVRKAVREQAKISVRVTKKGRREIDENHTIWPFRYLKNKPITELTGSMFLQIDTASKDKLVTYEIHMDPKHSKDSTIYTSYFDEVKQYYHRDEFSSLVQTWNAQRFQALEMSLRENLYPQLTRELRNVLLQECQEGILRLCARKVANWLQVAPFPCESGSSNERSSGVRDQDSFALYARVLAVCYTDERDESSYAALVNPNGECVDFLKLPYILKSTRSPRPDFKMGKEKDLRRVRDMVLRYKPDVIAIGCENRLALGLQMDFKRLLAELEAENELSPIQVELVDNEAALVFQSSKKADTEFRDYPGVLRQAVSVARRLQDPLVELSQLVNEEEDIMCLRLHPLQDHLPKDSLLEAITVEFVNRVNEVGVDVNRCLALPHTANLIQFVSGFGPRKGQALLRLLKRENKRLLNRWQLVQGCGIGTNVFINCAGFIRIDTSVSRDSSSGPVDLLDGCRVHPEAYDLAKKMAIDALEYEDTEDADPNATASQALEEILDSPERLRDLDLDAFAEELRRQDHGDKHITLYDIRAELNHRYKDLRIPYSSPNSEERFHMITKETPETFHIGRLIDCTVINVTRRRPQSEQLDNANPTRDDSSGYWLCPFCMQANFYELSDVWSHFDQQECPGQPTGVRVLLDNGVMGFIPNKMLSDRPVKNPEERVRPEMVVQARVLKIRIDDFSVVLTSRTSDLRDLDHKWRPQRDVFYDYDQEEEDELEESKKNNVNKQTYVKRVLTHDQFKNISYQECERRMRVMDPGDVIIRPSSKGADHLTVSWKVDDGIIQHIDVLELEKPNPFTLGKVLRINNEDFEELDEILARHVQPMVSLVRDVMTHKLYRRVNPPIDGPRLDLKSREQLELLLAKEKKGQPSRIPYFFTTSRELPGKFLLSYMPRERPVHEYFTVTPDAFRFRGRMFDTLPSLISWFKEHYREIHSNVPTPVSQHSGRHAHQGGSHHHSGQHRHHRQHQHATPAAQTPNVGYRGVSTPVFRDPRATPGAYQTPAVLPTATPALQNMQSNAALAENILKTLASMKAGRDISS